MSVQPDVAASQSEPTAGFARPTLRQLLVIVGVVVITASALVLIDHRFGPDVRPATTPSGWTPVYGDGFALSLPASWDVTTKEGDLVGAGIPGAVMVGAIGGSDQQTPDALAVVIAQPGSEAGLATSIGGPGHGSATTLPAGDATMYQLTSSDATGRAWLLDDGGTAWGILVLVRNGSSYAIDDLAPKIANSFAIS
jgi:hypothetical protein